MNGKTYLCTLKPIGKFFFGGEKTFGQAGSSQTNYLVRSNPFPQQTTLLGMIRFELLHQNRLLPITSSNQNQVNLKIGPESFQINGNKNGFGIIDKLSPLFLKKGNNSYLVAGRDVVSIDKKSIVERINFSTLKKPEIAYRYNSGGNFQNVDQIEIPEFHHKDTCHDHFVNISNSNDSIRFNSVFVNDSQIGIEKNKTTKGFYKQYFFKMNSEFCFAFYLTTTEAISELKNKIVFMGADKSAFALSIEENNNNFFEKFTNLNLSGQKITLLSDAYVDHNITQSLDFALMDSVTFRNIETTTNPNHNYSKSITKSAKVLHLFKRGSVLYSKNLAQTINDLNNENFIKIGYNIFKID